MLHRMRIQPFTPKGKPQDITLTKDQLIPDPEVRIKHDDLYNRAWETEFGEPNYQDDRLESHSQDDPVIRNDQPNFPQNRGGSPQMAEKDNCGSRGKRQENMPDLTRSHRWPKQITVAPQKKE